VIGLNSYLLFTGSGGGGTAFVLIDGAELLEPLEAELVEVTLEAELVLVELEAELVDPLEAELNP